MTPGLLLLAGALIALPLLPLGQISDGQITRARDWWLLGTLTVAAVAFASLEPMFSALALWFLVRWRSHRELPSLLTWVAIAGLWFAVLALPGPVLAWLPAGWLAVAFVQTLVVAWQAWEARRATPEERLPIRGTLGQRTIQAGFFALVAPFAPWWCWPWLAVGLWLTGPSWTVGIALVIGLEVLAPWFVALSGPLALVFVAAVAWDRWHAGSTRVHALLPRGTSLDTLWSRLACWRVLAPHVVQRGYWRWGAGPNAMPKMLRRLNATYGRHLPALDQNLGDAHNEPLHFVAEYGALGAAAMGLFALRVGARLEIGDPWSAAVVIGAVLTLASIPCRVAPLGLTWWVIAAGLVGR